ncbi:MAG: cation diffusion facilitator family transporter [Enterococcus sp.]
MEKLKSSGMFAVFAALGANVLVAISKFIGFAISGSAAMLNESIHSVVDCSNQVLLLFGDKRANRGQSELHQFGEGRAKYFFSTIVAMMLFFGGGALGVMEAFEKLVHPEHEVTNSLLVIIILLFGLAIEGTSLRVAIKEINVLNTEKLSVLAFLRESRQSEIMIIFIEDFCAVIGLLIALLGTILTSITGIAQFDAISGLLIGLLLMGAALFLAKEFYSLIIGESVTTSDLALIKQAFTRDEVKYLLDLKTIHLGPSEIMIAAKIDVTDTEEDRAFDVVNAIEESIRKSMPNNKVYIYIETDQYDPNYQKH